ncbi:MAG TPA: aldo/keto reductase [Anaerolineales bacterium]|nr:aldo/keto reductase [Anaerolineales bacterium]
MRYKLLGRSGLRVSELCLGTMTFGDDWGWGAPKEESKRMFDLFAEAGGNFIDTANNYTDGTSEQFVGEFVKGDRDHFVIATKYTLSERGTDPNFGGNHRKNMRRSVEGSLRRLDTDHIDLLWLHMWDGMTPVEEVMRALDDLVRDGKVLYVGISDTPAWVVSQANTLAGLRGWTSFVAYQGDYSLASRSSERDILPMTNALEMSFLAWGLLEGGELTGKYNSPSSEPKRSKETSQRIKNLAGTLMDLAGDIGRMPSQIALNWARQKPYRIIPILGARTENQLKDNLGCLDFELTEAQIDCLEEASPIDLGFPHSFLTNDHVRGLIFGKTFSQIVRS